MDYLKKIHKDSFCFKAVVLCLLISFGSMSVVPASAFAQSLSVSPNFLPLSPSFTPTLVRGIRVYPDNPLKFDFIVDSGDTGLKGEALKKESEKLIRYFLASLTLPEDELWVNLSPYEKDRIIPKELGQTEMGLDMLSQDYLLKQITASLTNPDSDLGKEFWSKVYKQAYEQYGTTNIPVDTFNKVWIMPSKAEVYVQDDKAFIVDSKLKVMLEEDYLSKEKNLKPSNTSSQAELASPIVREVFIPALEKEVNEGKNFSQLRQIYNCIILSYWYKTNLKNSILNKVYSNQHKVKGIDLSSKDMTEKIYAQYLDTFKKGVCNMMKVEYDPYAKKSIPRKYFAGGVDVTSLKVGNNVAFTKNPSACSALLNKLKLATIILITIGFNFFGSGNVMAHNEDLNGKNPSSVTIDHSRATIDPLGAEPLLLVDQRTGNDFDKIVPVSEDSIIYSKKMMIGNQEVNVVFSKEDKKIFGETFEGGKEIRIYLGSVIRNTQKTLDSIFVEGSSLGNILDSATLSEMPVQDLGVNLAIDLTRLILIHEAMHQERFQNDFRSQQGAELDALFRRSNLPEELKRAAALELEAYLAMLCSGNYSKLIFMKLALMQNHLKNNGKEEFYVSQVIAKALLDRLGYKKFIRAYYKNNKDSKMWRKAFRKDSKAGDIYRDFTLVKEFLKNVPDRKLQEKAFYFYHRIFFKYPIIDADFNMDPIKTYIKGFKFKEPASAPVSRSTRGSSMLNLSPRGDVGQGNGFGLGRFDLVKDIFDQEPAMEAGVRLQVSSSIAQRIADRKKEFQALQEKLNAQDSSTIEDFKNGLQEILSRIPISDEEIDHLFPAIETGQDLVDFIMNGQQVDPYTRKMLEYSLERFSAIDIGVKVKRYKPNQTSLADRPILISLRQAVGLYSLYDYQSPQDVLAWILLHEITHWMSFRQDDEYDDPVDFYSFPNFDETQGYTPSDAQDIEEGYKAFREQDRAHPFFDKRRPFEQHLRSIGEFLADATSNPDFARYLHSIRMPQEKIQIQEQIDQLLVLLGVESKTPSVLTKILDIYLSRLDARKDQLRQRYGSPDPDKKKTIQYKPSGSSSTLSVGEQKAIEALKNYLEGRKIYALGNGREDFSVVVKTGPLFDGDDPHRVDIYLRDANGQETENALLSGFLYPEQKEFILDEWNTILEQTFFVPPEKKNNSDLFSSANFRGALETLMKSRNSNEGRRPVDLAEALVMPQIFKILSGAIPGFTLSGFLRELQLGYAFGDEIFYDEESGFFKKKKGLGRDGYYWIVEKLSDGAGVAIEREDEIVTIGQLISRDTFQMDETSFLDDAQLCWFKMSDGIFKEEVSGFQNSLKRLMEYFEDANMETMMADEKLIDPLFAGTGSLEFGELWVKAKLPSAASSGLSGSWKEIAPKLLKLAEEKKVKVIFVDLDDTMFYPRGYVGSGKQKTESIIDTAVNLILKENQGHDNEFVSAEMVNEAIMRSKGIVYPQGDRDEKRMIDHQFFASDADREVLRSLKRMGVNIIGFTSRPSAPSKMRITLDILRTLGINGDIFDKVIFTSGDGKIKANRLAFEIKEYRRELRKKGKQIQSKEIFLIDDLKKNIISAGKLGYGISLVLVQPQNGTDKISWEEFLGLAKTAAKEKHLNDAIEYFVNAYMVAPRNKEWDILLSAERLLERKSYHIFTQALKSDDGITEVKDIIRPGQRTPSGVINVDELRAFVKDQLDLSQDFSANPNVKEKSSSSSITSDPAAVVLSAAGIPQEGQQYFSAFGINGYSKIISMVPQESLSEGLGGAVQGNYFRIRPREAKYSRPRMRAVGAPAGWQSWDTSLKGMQQSLNIDLVDEIRHFQQRNPGKRMVLVDWGCGTGRALNDLAKKLKDEKIDNVELIGFGDLISFEWLKGDASVTFFAGTPEDFVEFFLNTGKNFDLIVSLDGLNWIEQLTHYINEKLVWFMSKDGKIIFNPSFGMKIAVNPEFFDSEFVPRPAGQLGERQVITRKKDSVADTQPVTSDQLGGIDFNAKNMDVKVREEGSSGSLSSLGSTDLSNPTNSINFIIPDDLQGLVPVIINIAPINLLEYLAEIGTPQIPQHSKSEKSEAVPVANVYHLLGLSSPETLGDQAKPPIVQEHSNLPKEPAETRS